MFNFFSLKAVLLIQNLIFLIIIPALPAADAFNMFDLKEGRTVYGEMKTVKAERKQTLLDIAKDYNLGYNQIAAANPRIDPWVPFEGASVIVPTVFVLPKIRPPFGIVVNLAEMRLYHFMFAKEGKSRFWTCPVGVGKEGYSTKLSVYTVLSKAKDPIWVVPPSVLKEDPELPQRVLPGPENPLGKYILRFSRLSYGIHGTNRPWGVGRRVSHGCIRLYSEDIASLFPLVPVGTLVHIIYEPIKVGWAEDKCWLQVYQDYENNIDDPLSVVLSGISACEQVIGPLEVDFKKIQKAIKEQSGIPVPVAQADRE
jgi:L,D-transpeptidase ErfK/SrfK